MGSTGVMYELFYSDGGHGGPFHSLYDARKAAAQYLADYSKADHVDVCEYTESGYAHRIRIRASRYRDAGERVDPNTMLDDWRDASADALRAAKLLASWLRRGGFAPQCTATERADFERYCATHGIQLPTTFGGGDGE